ncbi:MAG: hypothetical protein KGH79_04270 [Patescibacteria group bacterium]|nr:hypothetical protein [Patescibacteria group bacterium]
MQPFRVPISIPDTQRVTLTQPFGPVSNPLEPEGPNGEPHFHYGIDLVCGDDHHTYGVAIVCPFPSITITEKTWEGAMNPTGNGIVGVYTDAEGVVHKIVLWHCSKINDAIEYKEGDVMAYIGNAGLVFPAPSLRDPYAGAHLHLGYYRGDILTDPLTAFDITNPYRGPAPTQALEMPPAQWVVAKIEAFMAPFLPQATPPAQPNQPTP